MENNNIINVSLELSSMKYHITDLDDCTSVINMVNDYATIYRSNYRINILTIITTVYALLCAIFRLSVILIILGIIYEIVLYLMKKLDMGSAYHTNFIWNTILIVSSIIFFMITYFFIPVVIVAVFDWIHVVICNSRLRNKIWELSTRI